MNEFQNVIIVASPYNIIGSNFSNDIVVDSKFNEVKCTRFKKLPCLNNEIYADTVNYLHVINKYMDKIKQKVENEKDNNILCRFFISQKIYSIITKGTYKYWILNGRTEGNNTPINHKEIEAWKEFSNLYSKVFSHVTFTSINFIMTKNIKYNFKNIIFSQLVINSMMEELQKVDDINLDNILKINE